MQSRKLILGGVIVLLLSGCEFESYKDYRNPSYEGAFTWTQVIKKR